MATTSKYTIAVNTTGAEAASKKLGGVSNSLSSMAKKAVAAGTAYFSAQGVINGMKRAIELAQEQIRVERVLQNTIGGSITKWKEFASAVQRVTNHGDEVILQQIAIAKQMRLSDAETKRLIVASLNLADAMGRDVQGVMMQLAKTYSGQRGEMGELVPAIRDMTSEQLQHGGAVKFVIEQYKGLSEASADGIKQQQNAWSDLMEVIGTEIKPVVEAAGKSALDWVNILIAYEKVFKGGVFNPAMVQDGTGIVEVLKLFGTELDMAKTSLDDLIKAEEEFGPILENELVNWAKTAEIIPIATAGLRDMSGGFKQINTDITGTLEVLPSINDLLSDNEQAVLDNYEAVQEWVGGALERYDTMVLENEAINELIANHRAEAEALGYVTSALEDQQAQRAATIQGMGSMMGAFAQLNRVASGNAALTKRLAQGEAIVNTYSAANKALNNPPGPPWTIPIMAATIVQGLANVAQIEAQKFARGGDFVTSGPQMIMVGDNPGGRERVQITPTSSPNIEGPRGGGVTINLQAGIVEQGTVAELADRLAHRLRRNLA